MKKFKINDIIYLYKSLNSSDYIIKGEVVESNDISFVVKWNNEIRDVINYNSPILNFIEKSL